MCLNETKEIILKGETVLGIEFGSTRIKSVLYGKNKEIIAFGKYDWENKFIDGVWTYSLKEIKAGLQTAYLTLANQVKEKYDIQIEKIGSIGISGMMHGYLPFDKDNNLLTNFRTWRNTITKEASEKLSELFKFNIPQRWSIAHLYQAILNEEEHLNKINFITTLSGYIHFILTGEKVLGACEASGMFPIDSKSKTYNIDMINDFNNLISENEFEWKLKDILPKILLAGEKAGYLTEEGTKILDPSGNLKSGSIFCPPEGDAGTGMVATNSIAKRTGNVSAGTSVFAMTVMERELTSSYPEIDVITTPMGDQTALVHCNNCTSDLNAWVNIFKEFLNSYGVEQDIDKIYQTLYFEALKGEPDCKGLLAYNYLSGEHITEMEEGRPLFVRTSESKFNLANFMRTHLYNIFRCAENRNGFIEKRKC